MRRVTRRERPQVNTGPAGDRSLGARERTVGQQPVEAAALAARAAQAGVLYQQGAFFAVDPDTWESSRHLRLA